MKYDAATYVGIKNRLKKMVGAGEKPLEHVPQVEGDYFEGVWSAIMLSLLLQEMQVNSGFFLNGLRKLDLKAWLSLGFLACSDTR
jgi:hypothetical protein